MHPWAQRHRGRLEEALDEGEVLLDADRTLLARVDSVSLEAGSAGTLTKLGTRRGGAALRAARKREVDLPGRGFVLAVTDRRIVVWRATPWLARPEDVALSWPRARVVSVRSGRRMVSRLSVLLDDGTLLVLRPYGGRRIDHLAEAFSRQ
jgi:hypothetical protein